MVSQVIPLEKLYNTRDLGGMTGAGGRRIRCGTDSTGDADGNAHAHTGTHSGTGRSFENPGRLFRGRADPVLYRQRLFAVCGQRRRFF